VLACIFFVFPPLVLLRLPAEASVNSALYLAVTAVHLADIASGFFGKRGRRHPFARLSPGKTVEGFAAGFCVAHAFAALALASLTSFTVVRWLTAGTLLWLGAVAGDLAASKVKRIAGVKDFGAGLGAHGGVADRLDSAVPVVMVFGLWILYRGGSAQ
jgi:phosphatidate cytidylyltransferase